MVRVRWIVVKEAIHTVYGDPFHDIDVFGQHHDCFEVPLDERCLDERAAEVQGLRGTRDGR